MTPRNVRSWNFLSEIHVSWSTNPTVICIFDYRRHHRIFVVSVTSSVLIVIIQWTFLCTSRVVNAHLRDDKISVLKFQKEKFKIMWFHRFYIWLCCIDDVLSISAQCAACETDDDVNDCEKLIAHPMNEKENYRTHSWCRVYRGDEDHAHKWFKHRRHNNVQSSAAKLPTMCPSRSHKLFSSKWNRMSKWDRRKKERHIA